MSYSGNTVAQLKELLKQRNLSTDGLKADLINRLQEDDAKNATEPKLDDSQVNPGATQDENKTETTAGGNDKVEQPQQNDETTQQSGSGTTANAESPVAPAATAAADASADAPADAPAAPKPQLSPEQLKQAAIEHLQKKIHRAEKFGQDDSILDDLKRQINRIEKFGLDLTTQLAQELGFGNGPRAAVGKPDRKPFQKKHKNKNKNKKSVKRN